MNNQIKIRIAHLDDSIQIGRLIYETIRIVNSLDYSENQIEAWAPDPYIFSKYDLESFAYVAEFDNQIVGFGNITLEGYLHRFYIHHNYQRQGIGSLLLHALEAKAKELNFSVINTEASISAKSFFQKNNWLVVEKQIKIFRGVSFINYKMSKELQK